MNGLIALIALFSDVITPGLIINPPNEVSGFYSNGAILTPTKVALRDHLFFFHPERDRSYSSTRMAETLYFSTAALTELFPESESLGVGDISAQKGGELSGHASHQNGLDVDVSFYRSDFVAPAQMTSVVKNGVVSDDFDKLRNFSFIQIWVEQANAQRIFIDGAIKHSLCQWAYDAPELTSLTKEAKSEVLRRLRPYPNHDNHFHIRLRCPAESKKCLAQAEVPEGDGCDSTDQILESEAEGC